MLDYDLAALDPDQLQDLLDDLFEKTRHGLPNSERIWSGIGMSNRDHVLISRRLLVWNDRCGRHFVYGADGEPCEEAEEMRAAGKRTYHMISVWKGTPRAFRRRFRQSCCH